MQMKQFLKKSFFFITIPILLVCLVFAWYRIQLNGKLQSVLQSNTAETVFIGDSHVQYAVNTDMIPNSINYSNTSESYYFTYYKLCKVLDESPKVKRVVLGLGYHSLSGYYDRFILGDYSQSVAPKYFFVLPMSEQLRTMYWHRNHLFIFMKSVLVEADEQQSSQLTFLGKFLNEFDTTQARISSMEKRLKLQFESCQEDAYFSTINASYLDKIIALCKEKKIELLVLNTPLHEYYRTRVPQKMMHHLASVVQTKNLKMIDVSGLLMPDRCYIPDGDHVSLQGANTTSAYLQRLFGELH